MQAAQPNLAQEQHGINKGILERFLKDPNAIWMREMRQSARLGRTPWILFAVTLVIALLVCSIGGIAAATSSSPASIGGGLFQVFFSLAYLVVVLVGPTVAANSIASEREGKTWEAVLLTGLTPKKITRGKFMAAYTTIALYIVVLAPVGALSFLFGGVTATEVVVAFLFLFFLAGLGVAFGLAVSSLMSSLRGAIVVTLMLAIVIGPMLYFFFGFLCSFAIHKLWPEVPEAFPVWLPLAYSRAKFGAEYMAFLLAIPLLLILMPAWFLYEVTVSNLTGDADDRSSGIKRWFAVCTPLMAIACALPSVVVPEDEGKMILCIFGQSIFVMHLTFCALLFAFEPPGPSRRVRIHWEREKAGFLKRFFGPGLTKTSLMATAMGIAGLLFIAFVDIGALLVWGTGLKKDTYTAQMFVFAIYSAPFFLFLMGLTAWLRSRGNSPWIARLIASAILFLILAGPWIVAAIGGILSRGSSDDWIVIAAPSPFYVFYMLSHIDRASPTTDMPVVLFGLAAGFMWGMAGLMLLTFSARRCAKQVREYDAAIAQAEAALKAEEEHLAAQELQQQQQQQPPQPA
jgi:hypothetical protein